MEFLLQWQGFRLPTKSYQKKGTTYFDIDDLTQYSPEKAEGTLKEVNNYMSQLMSIHEAATGHCVQGIYNTKSSSDIVRWTARCR